MTQVFISYSRKDLEFVKTLAKDLEASGLKAWYDISNLEIGKRWAMEIQVAIQASQYFIVVISRNSIASKWVEREFIYAENRKIRIIPLIIEPCELPLWAVSLQFIDMVGTSYEKALGELLKELGIKDGAGLRQGGLDARVLPGGKPARAPARFSLSWIIILLLLAVIGLGAWAILRPKAELAASQTAAALTATSSVASSTPLQPQSYNVQGKLFWNDQPAPGVELKMTGMAEEGFFLAVTDATGSYTFEVPPGNYVLHYRFPEEVDWTASQATPYFTPYHYSDWPIVVEADTTTYIDDIHTIKAEDLEITYPDPHQEQVLSTKPTFEWSAYPSADHYLVWLYKTEIGTDGAPYSIPAGQPAEKRGTSVILDWSIPEYDDYYVWVIAYNVNDHELADGHASFAVVEP